MSSLDFHSLSVSAQKDFIKHNPVDYDAFKKFQAGLDERFSKTEEEREKRERRGNLTKWTDLVGRRWADATLKTIENEATKAVVSIIKKKKKSSFWIHGESGSGKSYLAYAIVRAYIGLGWTTPSRVLRISEGALLGMATTGFEGMARFNKLLTPQYNVYFIDGVETTRAYSDREKQLLEQLIDHIYSHSLTVIFTSTMEASDFGCKLSDSADSKLDHLVGGHEVESVSTYGQARAAQTPPAPSGPQGLQFSADGTLL